MLKKVTMKFHTQNCLTTTAVRIIDKAMLDSERAVQVVSEIDIHHIHF